MGSNPMDMDPEIRTPATLQQQVTQLQAQLVTVATAREILRVRDSLMPQCSTEVRLRT